MVAPDFSGTPSPDGVSSRDVGIEILNETIKSFGFNYDEREGVSWSVENIQKAFKDDPIWTTLDYMTLAFPAAKWGTAAVKVSKGVGKGASLAHSAYRSGDMGLREAMKLYERTPKATNRLTRLFESPIGREMDSEFVGKHWNNMTALDQGLLSRGFAQQWKREQKATMNAVNFESETIINLMNKVSDKERLALWHTMDARPGTPVHEEAKAQLGELGQRIYERQIPFRNWLHDKMFEVNAIGPKAYKKNHGRFQPHIIAELSDYTDIKDHKELVGAAAAVSRRSVAEVQKKLKSRRLEGFGEEWAGNVRELGLTPVLDPRASIREMARKAQLVAETEYLDKLAKSKVVRPIGTPGTEDWIPVASLWPGRKADPRKFFKQKDVQKLKGTLGAARKAGDDVAVQRLTARMDRKWHKFTAEGARRLLSPDWMDNVVDPIVADELKESVRVFDFKNNPILNTAAKINGWFKASKTAFNPATHGRNLLSGIVFNSLASGKLQMAPYQGTKTMWKALKGDKEAMAVVREAQEIGVLGHNFREEVLADLLGAYGKADGAADGAQALDKVGGALGKFYARVGDKAVNVYGLEDEVWKLNAYIANRAKFAKRIADPETAKLRAAHEVTKYFPMYGDSNAFTQTMRQFVPFLSFTTESFRVWKNAMAYKPHWVYGWAHSSQYASELSAAMLGVTPEQRDAAEQAMPAWSQDKLRMMLPWRDDEGALQWLDMSYLIPLADMAGEAEKMEGSLFGLPEHLNPLAGFGLTSNPIVSTTIGAVMGRDPFTGREVEPEQLERYVTGGMEHGPARNFAGMVEHVARQMAPPWMPPGYAGTNLVELLSGARDPRTGDLAEPNPGKTLAANLLGLRAISPSESGARGHFIEERKQESKAKAQAWRRLEYAMDNENLQTARRETERLVKLYGGRRGLIDAAKKRSYRLGGGGLAKDERFAARERAQAAGGQLLDPKRGEKVFRAVVRLSRGMNTE